MTASALTISSKDQIQYLIEDKIAQGGMAEIFRGRAVSAEGLERPVVIKRILPHIAADQDFVAMLVDEAKLAVQLSHGNIAQVYDLGRISDDYFMVMEFVDGESLSHIARHLRKIAQYMPIPIALFIIAEVANGLSYMHNKKDAQGQPLHIVHRDISPQNVLISWSGTVKIIDFGIAKASSQISTTDSGVLKGKFAYMSPEHVHGDKIDQRADIFSLGVILWELITNQRLFKEKTNRETIQKVKRCRVPSVLGYREETPAALDRILKRALSKQVKQRYANAQDFHLDLIRLLVQEYPDFAPKHLQDYLRTLFVQRTREENTIVQARVSQESPTPLVESEEATSWADPKILQRRLKELETYDMEPEEMVEELSTPQLPNWKQQATQLGQGAQHFGKALLRSSKKIFAQLAYGLKQRLKLITWCGCLLALGWAGWHYGPKLWAWQQTLQKDWFEVRSPTPRNEHPPKSSKQPEIVKPMPLATLSLDSQPSGAQIFINDRDSGETTPATLNELKAGNYRIGFYLKPYQYVEQAITLAAGQALSLNPSLQINYGSLMVISVPPQAQVWLDGAYQGVTPLELNQLLPEQIYQVRVQSRRFADWTQSVKIFPGKTQRIDAVLKRNE